METRGVAERHNLPTSSGMIGESERLRGSRDDRRKDSWRIEDASWATLAFGGGGWEMPRFRQIGEIVFTRCRFRGLKHGASYRILRGDGLAGGSRYIAYLQEMKKPGRDNLN